MKLRTLLLSVAVLAALSAAAFLLQRPSKPANQDPRVGQAVFDTKNLEKAVRVRLVDQGKTVLLTKQSDGKWIDSLYFELPVDLSKLSRFLDDLSNAKIQRLVTQNPERLARLDFKDTSIALLDSGEKELWLLSLGKSAEGGGRFVKFGSEPRGYLANFSVFLDAEAKNWADTSLIDLKPDDIAALEVGFAEGAPLVATRAKKEEAWAAASAPAGQRIKSDRIASLLSSFTGLRFQDTSDLNDANVEAARKHLRTIKLTTFDHKTVTIELGRKPEEKKEIKSQKPEAGGQHAAPNPAGESGKPEAGGQTSAVSIQTPETGSQPAASAAAASPEPKPTEEAPAKAATPKPESSATPAAAVAPPPAKPEEPKVETVPAGPVYAFITSSDPAAPVNALMKKRAFQISDWNFTSLPQKPDELWEPVPPPPQAEKKPEAKPEPPTVAPKPTEKPADTAKP
jgi:hypothetical protein